MIVLRAAARTQIPPFWTAPSAALVYAIVAFALARLAEHLPGNPKLSFCLLGGLELVPESVSLFLPTLNGGSHNRILGAIGVAHVTIGGRIGSPNTAINQVAILILAVGREAQFDFPGPFTGTDHPGQMRVPVVKVAHEAYRFIALLHGQDEGDLHLVLELAFKHLASSSSSASAFHFQAICTFSALGLRQ